MSKKTILSIASILLLGTSLVAEAKSCIGCSSQIPDSANYCSHCMTPQPQAALIGQQAYEKTPHEVVLEMFSFLDSYEAHFHDMQYLNILGKMPEVKTLFQNASNKYKNLERVLPEECRLLAKIYAAKYQLFDGITNVMKNLRIDSGYKNALQTSALLVVSYYNGIINQFRTPRNWSRENIEILKKQIENVSAKTCKYRVTSKFLKIDDTKVQQGESVMVLGLEGKNAHVMYMGPSATLNAVQGVVSLASLEKRTSWKKANEFLFQPIELK